MKSRLQHREPLGEVEMLHLFRNQIDVVTELLHLDPANLSHRRIGMAAMIIDLRHLN